MTLQEYNQEWENRLKASQAKYDEDLKAAHAETEAAHAETEAIRAENETAMKAIRAENEAAIKQAEARAARKADEQHALTMLSKGFGEETVSECLGLPIEEVIKLRKRS